MDEIDARYVRTAHGHLAYQLTGRGDHAILFISGTVTHVEIRWEIPHLVRIHRRLMTFARVLTYDPLGIGASDPLPDPPPGLGEVADDVMTLLDAVGIDRCSIVATVHGVPAAIVMADRYPDRVEKLVLVGGYARLFAAPDYPIGIDPAVLDAFFEATVATWGDGTATPAIYGIDPDPTYLPRYARLERAAVSPGALERVLRWITASDVRAEAARLTTPTLLYGVASRLVPGEVVRALADLLPDGRLIELDHDPLMTGEGLDEMMGEIAEFVTGSRAASHADRRLAAVLFTDVVGSTQRVSSVGDVQWRDELESFRITVRREINRHGGREVNTRGDDFLVEFDRASSAVECAVGLSHALPPDRLQVRSGVHVGEVEVDGDDLTGVAVHVGARVAALAGPGEILVTTAVRQAVTGMNWTFVDRGVHELKGVPDEWHLFAVDGVSSLGSGP